MIYGKYRLNVEFSRPILHASRLNKREHDVVLTFKRSKRMRTTSKIFAIATIATVFLTTAGMVSAQGFGPGRGKGPGVHGQKGPKGAMRPGRNSRGQRRIKNPSGLTGDLRGLNLTEGQREQVRAIMEANRPSEAERKEHQEIMRAMRNGTATEQQKSRAKEIAAARIDRQATVSQQIRGILTAEQLATLDKRRELREERMERMRERRQNRPNRIN